MILRLLDLELSGPDEIAPGEHGRILGRLRGGRVPGPEEPVDPPVHAARAAAAQ